MSIHIWQDGTVTVVRPVGDLDIAVVPRLRAELDAALTRSYPPRLVIDLTGVPFCDSTGLGLLINTLTRVRDAHGRLALAVSPGMITHLLTITNLHRHFPVYETPQAALDSMSESLAETPSVPV